MKKIETLGNRPTLNTRAIWIHKQTNRNEQTVQNIYTAGTGKGRAAIVITNSNIDAILISKLSDEARVVLEIVYEGKSFLAANM